MDNKVILTIGRQFGSGGREVGEKLAKALHITYYDKELLAEAAKESGFNRELFEKADECTTSGLQYAVSLGFSYMGMMTPYPDILSNDGLFRLQSEAIRKIADRESCVLVGRCADYILRDYKGLISFFIHNTTENRIERIIEQLGLMPEQAKDLMLRTDKSRAAYYNYFTNKVWGASASYDLSIDVSVLGLDESVKYMMDFVLRKMDSIPPHFG